MLVKRMMLLLLAVLCCLGWTVKAELTTSTANDCAVCLSPVNDRTGETKTQENTNIIKAMPCGHHTSLCNGCFNTLIMSNMEHTVVPCPLCRASLKLNEAMKKRIEDERRRRFRLETEKVRRQHRISLNDVLQRWPKILEIGNMDFLCADNLTLKLLACAYAILKAPGMEDTVTETMEIYTESPTLAMKALTKELWPLLYDFRHARVYDYYGELLSFSQAVAYSLNSVDGEAIEQNLLEIRSDLLKVSNTNVDETLSAYPELLPFQQEIMQIDGINLKVSIRKMVHLLKVPLLNTKWIQEILVSLNQGFLEAETMVDDYIAENWPQLLPFKNIGRFTDFAEPYTIRELAKMVYNPAMTFQITEEYLNNLKNSAIVSIQRLEQLAPSSSASVQYAQNNYLENAPGGRISIYTAMLYSINAELSPEEKNAWSNEIAKAMEVFRINPGSNQASRLEQEVGRVEGSLPLTVRNVAQRVVVHSSNSELFSRRRPSFRTDSDSDFSTSAESDASTDSDNRIVRLPEKAWEFVETACKKILSTFRSLFQRT